MRELQAAVAEWERALGPDHPRTIEGRITLAEAYRSTPEYADAEQTPWEEAAAAELAKAVESRTRTLGPESPETLEVREELALVRWGAEGSPRLIAELEAIAAARERILGRADPSTLETLSRLEFWASGARRAELRERILHGWREVVASRPTVHARMRLGAVSHSYGREEESRAQYELAAASCERIVAARTRELGAVHPDTVAARERHARCVRRLDGPAEAARLTWELAADQERLLGADHPDTLRTLVGLASDSPPDESLLARAYAVLGPDDRDVAFLRGHLIVAYAVAGRDEEALALVPRYPVAADDDVLDEAELP
ncbi:hypothetical protein [Paractinoplanes atraurantiacus]|uniref:Tetratricopeptide repeat-containing protein n=1 Tax=Paractinoplanes atraurantiacus TaxID=1036182 RepID=A0A285JU71_9ACTN|nr:hypothetical protein [Actinoplanes atraurantiacus]SNY62866.1 hypothetical protein SAMN05421748_12459 [Actinoplanes atraurantiacus]